MLITAEEFASACKEVSLKAPTETELARFVFGEVTYGKLFK
jgi:hypothetical protein